MELNKRARIERHRRTLAEKGLVGAMASTFSGMSIPFRPLTKFSRLTVPVVPVSNKKAVVRNILIIGVLLLGFTGFSNGSYSAASASDNVYSDETFVTDQDGFFAKTITDTGAVSNITTRNKGVTHIVGANETLSEIANMYGLKTQTLTWENSINPLKMRAGDQLVIPPFDGVGYTVKKGDTVDKIASKYHVSGKDILAKNEISGVGVGDKIFIPNAKPLVEDTVVARNTTTRTTTRTNLSSSNSKPGVGKILIFPTIGSLTQGFHTGHYAYDIANSTRPPIWAAADGVVVKASSGTWGGGYGNHIIIDHGNGVKTLYGHMEYLNVSVGDHVKQGQVIGKMGNTGRVRGVTGIHLHFEVIDNGVKKVPSLYY